MTDGQWLFITFLALYWVESLRWLPPQTVLLVGRGGDGGWRWVRPSSRFRLAGRAAVVLPMWPPLAVWRICSEWVFLPEADHLEIAAEERGGARLKIPWSALQPRVDGARLGLTAQLTVPTVDEAEAQLWVVRLKEWKEMASAAREAAFVAGAERSLETGPMRAELKQAEAETRWLRRLGSVITLWCYGLISAVYWRFGESVWLLLAVAVLLGLMFAQALLFVGCCRRRSRLGQPAVPWWRVKTLGILLFPPLAIRAADALLVLQTHGTHPLAGRGLVAEPDWQAAAALTWREAVYRPGWKKADGLRMEGQVWRDFFEREKVRIETLDRAPHAVEMGDAAAYCPRCLALFHAGVTVCADCDGVELIGLREQLGSEGEENQAGGTAAAGR